MKDARCGHRRDVRDACGDGSGVEYHQSHKFGVLLGPAVAAMCVMAVVVIYRSNCTRKPARCAFGCSLLVINFTRGVSFAAATAGTPVVVLFI